MASRKRQRLSIDGEAKATANGEVPEDDIDLDRPDAMDAKPGSSKPSRSLFIRSLPLSATTDSLTTHFSQSYPLKHATVVVDPTTKKSKGYGFVTFADAEDAERAREEFNGSTLEGKKLKIDVAQPRHRDVDDDEITGRRTSRPSAAATKLRAHGDKSQMPPQAPKLIVRNLPWSITTPEQLAHLFRSYGKVKFATLPKAKGSLSPGFGFVVLRGRKNAAKALAEVNGKIIDGRTVAVDWAVEKDAWLSAQRDGRARVEGGTAELIQVETDADAHGMPSAGIKHDGLGDVVGDLASHDDGVDEDDEEDADDAADDDMDEDEDDDEDDEDDGDGNPAHDHIDHEGKPGRRHRATENLTTLFIRNLPFHATDKGLLEHFTSFGAVRYARVVLDHSTGRSKGTGFVCYYNLDDAAACLRHAPRPEVPQRAAHGKSAMKHSLLEDTLSDPTGRYTMEGRVLQVSSAVDRGEAARLATQGTTLREARDKDKRRLYLLSEGTVPSSSPLHAALSATESRMRDDSAKQRQALIKSNPSLHLSLTRLSIRNIPRNVTSKDLKALAREAVVGFAKDVKQGTRLALTKEELSRGGQEMKAAEVARKAKGKGIVKQTKIVFEGREGAKVAEDSGAGRSRGYGFVEYSSHRWALMGLRWLNGHVVTRSSSTTKGAASEKSTRLIVEFAIENAQVVARRHDREVKARDRSTMISAQRAAGELPVPRKVRTQHQLVVRNAQLQRKRKRDGSTTNDVQETHQDASAIKAAQRQRIIGRKRAQRRARTTR